MRINIRNRIPPKYPRFPQRIARLESDRRFAKRTRKVEPKTQQRALGSLKTRCNDSKNKSRARRKEREGRKRLDGGCSASPATSSSPTGAAHGAQSTQTQNPQTETKVSQPAPLIPSLKPNSERTSARVSVSSAFRSIAPHLIVWPELRGVDRVCSKPLRARRREAERRGRG
jgi:hypothetical protein